MLSHEQVQIAWMILGLTLWCIMILYKDKFVVLKRIVFAIITVAALISLVGTMMWLGPIWSISILIGGLIYMVFTS